jgi:hypothetical protein
LGIFAGYLLVLKRESRRFPWIAFLQWVAAVASLAAFCVAMAVARFHLHLTWHRPFLVR